MLGGRWGRPDRKWNLLALCHACHERLQDGRGNLSVCLFLKRESDVKHYSRAAMQRHMERVGTERLIETARFLPGWIRKARDAR